MTQEPERDWSTTLALSVAQEVRRHRQAQGLSAQQLADRCSELGVPIQRSVLANLESGRRTTVTVAEVLVLAAALGVPPALLIFPVGYRESVEMLPGVSIDPLDAADWLNGVRSEKAYGFRPPSINPLSTYRRHRALSRTLRRLLSQREMSRADFVQATERRDGSREELDAIRHELREKQVTVADHRERWRDVPLDERVETPPQVVEAKNRISELLHQERELQRGQAGVKYLKELLKRLDENVDQNARDLAKIRRDIREAGWIVPKLRDDLYGIVPDLPWQEGLFASGEFEPEEVDIEGE